MVALKCRYLIHVENKKAVLHKETTLCCSNAVSY